MLEPIDTAGSAAAGPTREAGAPQPLISVGIPVCNGARHLAQALDSVLAQTWQHLEIIVSDNASTDDTAAIVQRYRERDPRIRYQRFEVNRGVAVNWNTVAQEARGEYFKWLAAGDVMLPTLLERCAAVLRQQPEVVMVYGRTRWIDDDGLALGLCEGDYALTAAAPHRRFAYQAAHLGINNQINAGLIRTAALRRTRLEASYPSSDLVLMAELALHGPIVLLPDELFHRRSGPEVSTPQRTPLQIARMYDPQATRPRRFVALRRQAGRYAACLRAPVPRRERLLAAGEATRLALRGCRRRLMHALKLFRASGLPASTIEG